MNKSLYALPELYHLAFSWDLTDEIEFYQSIFKQSPFPIKNILEPACGSGRYFQILEDAGYNVHGYDVSEDMITYANLLIQQLNLKSCTAEVADMISFKSNKLYDAALNPVNSFRYLLKDKEIIEHLKNTADMLRPGAFYIIEFCYAFMDPESKYHQKWNIDSPKGIIKASWEVLDENQKSKISREKSILNFDNQPFEEIHKTRLWTFKDFQNILKRIPEFELEGIYDHDFMRIISPDYFGEMGNLYHVLKKK
ncbi:MAG: class I SAM-dependent methyltransferase [Candidatus Marinimicrobia bacterium]|nr:class I SAM-dependent methyltransferase [Candidatus Neomarinimicrobiota bacterium]